MTDSDYLRGKVEEFARRAEENWQRADENWKRLDEKQDALSKEIQTLRTEDVPKLHAEISALKSSNKATSSRVRVLGICLIGSTLGGFGGSEHGWELIKTILQNLS